MHCTQCGAPLTLDVDNLQRFCPYCGNRILVDPVAFKEVLIQREITKRDQLRYDNEQRERASEAAIWKTKLLISLALGALGIMMFAVGIFMGSASGNGDSPWYALAFLFIFPLFAAIGIWSSNKDKHD